MKMNNDRYHQNRSNFHTVNFHLSELYMFWRHPVVRLGIKLLLACFAEWISVAVSKRPPSPLISHPRAFGESVQLR